MVITFYRSKGERNNPRRKTDRQHSVLKGGGVLKIAIFFFSSTQISLLMLGQLEKILTWLDPAEMGSEIAFEAQKPSKNG